MYARVNSLTKEITFEPGLYPNAMGDDTVQRLNFVMDRYTGNGTDLGSSDIYVYYTNGRGQTYAHPFPNRTLSDDGLFINFTWDFAREVAEYSAPTRFSISAKIIDGQIITNEWNSEIATLPIIRSIGHRDVLGPDSTSYDEFEELLDRIMDVERDISNLIEEAKGYSNISEAYAKGTMDGHQVGEEDYGYHDNSYYYKNQTDLVLEQTQGVLEQAQGVLVQVQQLVPESISNSEIDAITDN